MVLGVKQTPNHILHLLLSIFTGGLWLIVWFILIMKSSGNPYQCPSCGGITVRHAPKGFRAAQRA